ncbi:DMT family transporter [Pseudoflavitalea sp. X16]|uniref:DMT family transporter n=1 Tax=Paraflavitalea devenefica TaxID=2716334 RepID=UPI00141FCE5A|nr:DMT family transporter [Paraflavitalea devenefica]NII24171.1 DMT family transporter [Paraflavitalea devenefica]
MKFLFYILPVLAGVAMTVQSGINAQLRSALNHPILAAFISFVGGTIALALLLLFSKQAFPALSAYSDVNWYKFTGGLLGVFVVTVVLVSVQEIGAANMFVLIIAGQLVTALLMDHFGVLGMKESPITLQKMIGIVCLIVGAWLVNRK